MLQEYKTNTNIGVGIGLISQIAGRVIINESEHLALVGLLLLVGGVIAFIWGCFNYMKGKGYSQWLGLLGVFSIIGLIIMVFFPDKHKA